jgi:hypothetical protein
VILTEYSQGVTLAESFAEWYCHSPPAGPRAAMMMSVPLSERACAREYRECSRVRVAPRDPRHLASNGARRERQDRLAVRDRVVRARVEALDRRNGGSSLPHSTP